MVQIRLDFLQSLPAEFKFGHLMKPFQSQNYKFSAVLYLIGCSCTACPVWKTRILAARTITSMVTEQNALSLLGELYDRMELTNQNSLHGLLLVIEMVVSEKSKLLLKYCCHGDPEVGSCLLLSLLLSLHLNNRYIVSRLVCQSIGET